MTLPRSVFALAAPLGAIDRAGAPRAIVRERRGSRSVALSFEARAGDLAPRAP